MDKIAIYICNEILLSHKKEWNTAICSNMNGLKEYYVQWNKLEKDKHCTFSLNVECKKQNNKLLDIEEKIKARGLGAWRRGERGQKV